MTTLDGLIMLYGDIHRGLVHMRRSSLHMSHDMDSCDQGGEDQDMAWLHGLVAMEKGKSML